MSNMEVYRNEIITTLNYQIMLRYAYQEGAMENALQSDVMVDSAVELILNRPEYERILREQDLPMH